MSESSNPALRREIDRLNAIVGQYLDKGILHNLEIIRLKAEIKGLKRQIKEGRE